MVQNAGLTYVSRKQVPLVISRDDGAAQNDPLALQVACVSENSANDITTEAVSEAIGLLAKITEPLPAARRVQ